MADFHQAVTADDFDHVGELVHEYMQWVHDRLNEEYGIDFDVRVKVAQDMAELPMFSPPHGRLVLATLGPDAVGLGCLGQIGDELGEIKHLYVQPEFRGRGIGRGLLEYLLGEATMIGYRCLRLDSPRFMEVAHSLYRSCGFREIEPYPETGIPKEFHGNWVFMGRDLREVV